MEQFEFIWPRYGHYFKFAQKYQVKNKKIAIVKWSKIKKDKGTFFSFLVKNKKMAHYQPYGRES